MRNFARISTLAVVGLGLSAAATRADEEKIALDMVPKPVMKAFKEKFPKVTIKAAIKEVEDGKTTYEIESMLDDLSIDAVLKPDGEFVAIEKQMKEADLPAAVTAAMKEKYPHAEVRKIEELTQGEKVSYEVLLKKADGKSVEVVFDKKGKVLNPPKAAEEPEKN